MTRTSLPVLAIIVVSLLAACGGDDESLFEGGKAGTSSAGQGHGGGASGQAGSTSNGGHNQAGQSNNGGAAGFGGGQAGQAGQSSGGFGGGYGGTGGTGGYGGYAGGYGGSSYGGYGGTAGCAADPVTAPTNGACVATGSPGYQCNPITNSPCNVSAGEACDFDGSKFVCFPGSNTQTACQQCNSSQGPFCAGGFTCYGGKGQCTRFCCSNADCAPGTVCMMQPPTTLGICQAASNSQLSGFVQGTGGGGSGGYGGSSGTGGAGGGLPTCAHGPCQAGAPLDMTCDTCVGMLCMLQQSCCTSTWDSSCVSLAQQFCGCTP